MAMTINTKIKKYSICNCGCDKKMPYLTASRNIRRYINGHNGVGRIISEKTRNKMRIANKKTTNTEKFKERNRQAALEKNPINIEYFKKCNHKNAYILGYLFADGNLLKRKTGQLRLSFTSADKEIIEKIRHELSADNRKIFIRNEKHHVYYKKENRYFNQKKQYRMQICNYHFLKYLENFGMTPGRKCDRIKIPKLISKKKKYFAAFFRGFFDGDGTISSFKKRKQPGASIKTASYKFLVQCKELLDNFGIKSNPIKKSKTCNAFTLSFNGKQNIYNLYKFMYENSGDLYLSRKKKRFEEYFKVYNKKYFKDGICQLQ